MRSHIPGVAALALPFVLLLIAAVGLWVHRAVWMGALSTAIAAAYYSGALHGSAVIWIASGALLAWSYERARERAATPAWRIGQLVIGVAFAAYAIAMGLALLPGFERVVLVAGVVLSPGAAPYDIAVGFPKLVTGIFILGLINPALVSSRDMGSVLARAAPAFVVTVVVVMAAVLWLDYTAFAPKWTSLWVLWAPINLFFTCLSEEAFFRGFLQYELARLGSRPAVAGSIALVFAALLFGLAHLGGGVAYSVAAALAGLGYGWALRRTQRIEAAMAVHFGVNTVHFLWFVYPRLA